MYMMDRCRGQGRANNSNAGVSKESYDITVLMGGSSNEREISLLSGAEVASALKKAGHRVRKADITPSKTSALDRKGLDAVFIALHGEFGESGQVQQLCEQRGVRYTGSAPRPSQLGMDKAAGKQIFKRAGLTTPDWMIIEKFHDPEQVACWLKDIPVPVVVKPVDGGSSLDVFCCHDEPTRDLAIEEVMDTYGRAMLERFVPGREMAVAILGEEALPIIEIIPQREFFDYIAKYADDVGTRYVFDHGLDDETVARLNDDALTAHWALGCRDFSRVDFILDESGVPQVLEINTIPGFTTHSLVPMAAAKAGIDLPELVDRIVRMAMTQEICLS